MAGMRRSEVSALALVDVDDAVDVDGLAADIVFRELRERVEVR